MPHLVGPGLIGAAGPTSNFYTTPFPHKPGDKARDKFGNEYVFVDFIGTTYYGVVVAINSEYLARPLTGSAAGVFRQPTRIGVVVGGNNTTIGNATSDNGGWVQIYGLNQATQTGAASGGLASDGTVEYVCVAQTSVGSPDGTFSVITGVAGTSIAQGSTDHPRIYGMWVVPNATSAELTSAQLEVVSDFDQNGVSCWHTSGASGPASDFSSNLSGITSVAGATSAFIGNAYAVFLNYPYMSGQLDSLDTGLTT